ncbi:MAG: channel protein hemolysin family [Anaerosporomusa subterranea]|jgi:hemolysin III|nr:channel protein hemolysin family [Anaerosporomusa subterranea]
MEEKLNAITHGAGAILALAGLIILTVAACLHGSVWHIVSFSVYGASLFLLYLASTLYHSFSNEKLKHIFKIIDHSAIYLLIAGTYTPFTLILLHGKLGWIIFSVIWGLAGLGILLKIFFVKRFKILSTLCYLFMGWLLLIVIRPIIATLPIAGFGWLLAGGIFYTAGSVFYLWRRLPYHHAIWHLFVLAGSFSHFISVLYYVLPISVPA